MTNEYDPDRIAESLRNVSPEIKLVHATSEKKHGTQYFFFVTKSRVTTDDMVSICRDMWTEVRHDIPERPDGWAAAISAVSPPFRPMGTYYFGWAGRPDEWHLREGEERKATDHAEWLAFRSRLRATIAAIGTEGETSGESGDFSVSEHEISPLKLTLFVHSPEFLTTEVIAAVQNMLRDDPADRVVDIFPGFGDPFRSLWEGLEVRANSVVEQWDRQEAEQLLGDRLKIPRYARGSD